MTTYKIELTTEMKKLGNKAPNKVFKNYSSAYHFGIEKWGSGETWR
jgi:hypothetical protein